MSKTILSICVPTYNRPERIIKIINQIIPFQSEELELIISDNSLNSNTRDAVKKNIDPRIKYFQNKRNFGYDANLLLAINRARGEFVYILMDDDDIEIKALPWIINTIKKIKNVSYICGSLNYKSQNSSKSYYKFEDKILHQGFESLFHLLFRHAHASGIVLKKNKLKLYDAIKYIGCFYIHSVLVAQALISGHTLCTSKIFASTGIVEHASQHPALFKGRKYNTALGRLIIAKDRVQIIYDITKYLKNTKKIRYYLFKKQKKYIQSNLSETLILSLKDFLDGLFITITMKKISKSPKFWIDFIIEFIYHFIKSKFYKKYRPHGGKYYLTSSL